MSERGCGLSGKSEPVVTISPQPLRIAEDRSFVVPAGHVVRTGYVPCGRVDLACRDRMAIGDVDIAYRRRLQLGDAQPWPPPVGEWSDDHRFCLTDGRHEYIAAIMLGFREILVAWIEEPQ